MNRKIPYTTAEDIAIVQYLLNNFKNPKLGGINVWIEMESNLKINHSWQSLKERFRKVIIREIDNNEKYKITKCQASALKKMITPKYRSSNIRSNIQYSQRMRESKTPQQETNLNDSVINNNNCRISDRTDSVPTWTTPTPGTSNNYTNLNNSVQEIQEHQSIIEISSDEEDVVMGHTTQQNKQSNTSICSKESIIFRIQEIQETAEKRVVPGRSSDNTSNLVCESHKNLSDCVYCFFYNHIKPSGNLKPDFTQVSEICNDLNSSISNNKPINNGENNTTTSKKHKNNDKSLCTDKNNEAGETVTVSEICIDHNLSINNNKPINNGENNTTTSKKHKNNDKSLCTDKNNEADETVTVSEICIDHNLSINNNKLINNGENNTTTSKKLKNNDTSLCTDKNNEAGETVTVSEICIDHNLSINNNKPINNGENNTTTSKKLKNNDTSLCTGKNNEAGEMVTVSEICNDQNSIINNNKRINNGENNMTTSKKLKNNDKSLCTDKNNEAGETVTVQRKDSSLLGSNISDFRDDYDSGCETINYKPFQFICLVCTTRNNFFDVVSKTETKRKFEKNCNQCRSLFKLSYSNDQITSIRLLSNSQSNVNSSD